MGHSPMPSPRCLRAREAAAYLGISVSLFRQGARDGKYPAAVRISDRRQVWLREALDAELDRRAGRPNADGRGADLDPSAEWDQYFDGSRAA